MAGVQQWMRVYKPNGSVHLVLLANKDFYLKQNANLLMGPEPRRDLLMQFEELTPEENQAEHDRVMVEAARQSKKSKKLQDAALAASIATGGGNVGVSSDVVAELIRQNTELMNQLTKKNGKATV